MDYPYILNEDNFKIIERNEGVAVVRFFAPWCPPCQESKVLFDSFVKQLDQGITVGSVNIDQSPVITTRYEIWGLPTVLMFKDGRPIKRLVGRKTTEEYMQALTELA